MPPLPVVKLHGFYYFRHCDGRTSHAVTVAGKLHRASDYKQHAGVNVPSDATPIEPGDTEYVRLMGW